MPTQADARGGRERKGCKKEEENCSNPDSHLVSHDSTNESLPCLTLLIGREAVFSWRYGRRYFDALLRLLIPQKPTQNQPSTSKSPHCNTKKNFASRRAPFLSFPSSSHGPAGRSNAPELSSPSRTPCSHSHTEPERAATPALNARDLHPPPTRKLPELHNSHVRSRDHPHSSIP